MSATLSMPLLSTAQNAAKTAIATMDNARKAVQSFFIYSICRVYQKKRDADRRRFLGRGCTNSCLFARACGGPFSHTRRLSSVTTAHPNLE